MKNRKKKTGPKPDKVKLEGDWMDNVNKALKKPRPKDGWPEHKPKKKK